MPTYTYDPGKVVVNVNGVNMEAFAKGTFISAERKNDSYTMSGSSDGHVTRIHNTDKSGTLTITLTASSGSNGFLSALEAMDASTGLGIVPIMVKDMLGASLVSAGAAWIRKIPTYGASDAETTVVWVFDCSELVIVHGGHAAFAG